MFSYLVSFLQMHAPESAGTRLQRRLQHIGRLRTYMNDRNLYAYRRTDLGNRTHRIFVLDVTSHLLDSRTRLIPAERRFRSKLMFASALFA